MTHTLLALRSTSVIELIFIVCLATCDTDIAIPSVYLQSQLDSSFILVFLRSNPCQEIWMESPLTRPANCAILLQGRLKLLSF